MADANIKTDDMKAKPVPQQSEQTADAFMRYLKTNRENINAYNEKMIASGEYTYVDTMYGEDGYFPEGVTIPQTRGVEDVTDIIDNSLHQLHHDEHQVKDARGGAVKDDLEDKFLAWHRKHLFDTLSSIAKDEGFDVSPEAFEKELNGEINAILALNPKAGELEVLDKLLDEYETDK